MAAGSGSIDYIDFTDFTKGVRDGFQSAANLVPSDNGFATSATYGCFGHPGGGLFPLPITPVETVTHTPDVSTDRPSDRDYQRVLTTNILTPMRNSQGVGEMKYSDYDVPDQLFWAFGEIVEDPNNVSKWLYGYELWNWKRYKQTDAVPVVATEIIWDYDDFSDYFDTQFPGSAPAIEGQTDHTDMLMGLGSSATVRAVTMAEDPENVFKLGGHPHVLFQISPAKNIYPYFGAAVVAYPSRRHTSPTSVIGTQSDSGKYSSPNFDEAAAVPVAAFYGYGSALVYHQSRVLASRHNKEAHSIGGYTDGGVLHAGESWFWSRPNEGVSWWTDGLTASDALEQIFGPSIPSGIGCVVSTTASELLIIRHTGGGVVVRGDMESGQAITLPNLPSTQGMGCVGTSTPLGFVYGTRTGVWRWSGGDTAELLSAPLEGNFWVTPQEDVDAEQSKGKFNYTHPFIYCPNGWVLDVRTGGWFRVTDDDDELQPVHWECSAGGDMWGFNGWVGTRDTTTSTTLARRFSTTTEAPQYKWVSQPIANTRNRDLRYRNVALIASGHGTVTVTLQGLKGPNVDENQSIEFVVDSDEPIVLEESCKVLGTDLTMTIESISDDAELAPLHTNPAPRVHRLSLGFNVAGSVVDSGDQN